jgi:hypothetical protein
MDSVPAYNSLTHFIDEKAEMLRRLLYRFFPEACLASEPEIQRRPRSDITAPPLSIP